MRLRRGVARPARGTRHAASARREHLHHVVAAFQVGVTPEAIGAVPVPACGAAAGVGRGVVIVHAGRELASGA